jgi:hypothetical protein
MPVYWFENDAGDILEREFRMSDCPQSIEEDGVSYRKILAPVQLFTPEIHKATYWSGKRDQLQRMNNEIVAKKVASGEQEIVSYNDQPKEYRDDLARRIAKHKGNA